MADIALGIGKTARRAYFLDEVSIVSSRRSRDPRDVSLDWEIDAYHMSLPIMSGAADAVASPHVIGEVGRLGGLGVLNAEGLWCRYADPEPVIAEIRTLDAFGDPAALARVREIYSRPVDPDLLAQRIADLRGGEGYVAVAMRPQHTLELSPIALKAGVDLLVIRGSVVSAEFKSSRCEPLNLKEFIADLDVPVIVGRASSSGAVLHLMRTGAAGVLVGVGDRSWAGQQTSDIGMPGATAIADAAGARSRYLDESGGRYVHVIADGEIASATDVARAIACGADAVVAEQILSRASDSPGAGAFWDGSIANPTVPRTTLFGEPDAPIGTVAQILTGPVTEIGVSNLAGALRHTMAKTGYTTIKEFQRAELAVTS